MRQGASLRLRRDLIALAVISAAYLASSAFVTNSYYQLILTLVPIWAVFGVSWNILSGYGGQLSFGHASFFGIGAYTVTLALVYWNLTPWLGIPLGMLVGAVAAVLIGLPTFRLRGHYFALSMLAYPLAILYVLQYLGFQEMSLPMHRRTSGGVPAVHRSATGTPWWRSACWSRHWSSACWWRIRASASRCWRSGRTSWRPRRPASMPGSGRCARWSCRGMIAAAAGGLLRLRAAGGHAGFGVRHAGLGAGGGGDAVRRRRRGVGAGDRRRHPGAAGGITECASWAISCRASRAWSTASRSSPSCWPRRRGCSGRSATASSAGSAATAPPSPPNAAHRRSASLRSRRHRC